VLIDREGVREIVEELLSMRKREEIEMTRAPEGETSCTLEKGGTTKVQ
jgi:hypothetical protein